MTIVRLVPSAYTIKVSTASVLNPTRMYDNTDDTTDADVEIQKSSPAQALIAAADAAEAGINRITAAVTDIISKDNFSMDLITETAVIWHVG